MSLDADIAAVLNSMRGMPALDSLSVAGARASLDMMVTASPTKPELRTVENRSISSPDGPLSVRIYKATDLPAGIMVYYHGGGWVLGNLDSVDAPLRLLALLTGCCIVSIDYRLAPEHRFPAAVLDASYALKWVHRASKDLAGRPVPVVVAGDSAGANLATVAAILARDAGGPALAGQLLFYPVTEANFDTPSYVENADGMFLTRNMMRWFWDLYVPDHAQRADSRASPIRAPDLSRLPPALIQTAEYDPLRDEGEAYAKRLRADGTPVTLQRRESLRTPTEILGRPCRNSRRRPIGLCQRWRRWRRASRARSDRPHRRDHRRSREGLSSSRASPLRSAGCRALVVGLCPIIDDDPFSCSCAGA